MKKAFKYILLGLLAAFGIYVLVSFIVNKDGTMYWINYVVDLLNRPLPIVGITSAAVLVFIWRLVVATNYGKKVISGLRQELDNIKAEHEQYKTDSEKEKQELKENNAELKGLLVDVCSLSTNKKINDFGKALDNYGKETTDTETKAD